MNLLTPITLTDIFRNIQPTLDSTSKYSIERNAQKHESKVLRMESVVPVHYDCKPTREITTDQYGGRLLMVKIGNLPVNALLSDFLIMCC